MDYGKFVKNNKQYKLLLEQFHANKISHVCLLKSVDSNFAKEIAVALACQIVGSSLEQIKKKTHPDVFIYGEDGKIDVSCAGEIIDGLLTRPYSAKYKVYCLLNIENMNEASQNKLLKSFEEPPSDVIFLLTTANAKKVLPTILSRAVWTDIDSLSNEQITELLVSSGATKQAAEIAVSCCGENSTLAQKLTSEQFVNLYNLVLEMLENVNGSKDCLKYAALLDSKQFAKADILDITTLFIRDIAMVKSGAEKLVINAHHIQNLKRIAEKMNVEACSNIIEKCNKLKQNLFFNASGTAVLDNLLLTVAEEKTKCRK